MAKIRRKQNRIAEGLKAGFQRALNFGSARRNEVADSLNDRIEERLESTMEENYFEDLMGREEVGGSVLRPVPKVGDSATHDVHFASNPIPPVGSVSPIIGSGNIMEMSENGMRALAQNVFELGKVNEVRAMFLLLINDYGKIVSDGSKVDDYKERLAEFDKEVEIASIEHDIKRDVESINNIIEEVEADYEKLLECLENEDYSKVADLLSTITNKIKSNVVTPTGYKVGTLESHFTSYYSLLKRYKKLTGEELENININFASINFVKKVYGEIAAKIVKISEEIEKNKEVDPSLNAEYMRLVSNLEGLVGFLDLLLEEPFKFKDVKKEINRVIEEGRESSKKKPAKQKLSPESLERVKIGFQVLIDRKFSAIFEKTRDLVVQFKKTDPELEALIEDLRETVVNEKDLSDEIKEAICNKISAKYDEKLINLLTEDVYEFVFDYVWDLQICLLDLSQSTYGSNNFEFAYDYLKSLIAKMTESGEKANIKVSFDEDTQKLKIEFPVDIMKTYENQVVSDEVIKAMKNPEMESAAPAPAAPVPSGASTFEPAPSVSGVINPAPSGVARPVPPVGAARPVPPVGVAHPVPPVGGGEKPEAPVPPVPREGNPIPPVRSLSDDESVAIQDYINKLEEVNEIVNLINEINYKLEAQAVTSFINPLDAKRATDLEVEAKELDQRLIDLKIELSKDRLGFKQKFNKYILTIPEVKAIKLEEVVFTGDLSSFVAQHDEMIAEAENKIFELAEMRRVHPVIADKLNEDIQLLLDFIESQNSLVGRRLVSEAKDSSLDIVSLLKQRRENKKEIRERLRNVRDNVELPPAPVVPAPAPVNPNPEPSATPNPKPEEPNANKFISEQQAMEYLKEFVDLIEKELREQVEESRRTDVSNVSFVQGLSLQARELLDKLKTCFEEQAVESLLDKYENKYNSIVETEYIEAMPRLINALDRLKFSVTVVDVLEDGFENRLDDSLNRLTQFYYNEIPELNLEYNFNENRVSIEFVAPRYNFDTGLYEQTPVKTSSYDFLAVELYEAYKIKRQSAVSLQDDVIKNVGMYFIENYSNGKVVFQTVAKNYLTKQYGYSLEEVEAAIEKLISMGIVEDKRGVLLAIADKETFLSKMSSEKKDEKTAPDMEPSDLDSSQEPQINIVQRGLTFNPKNDRQLADVAKAVITSGDAVTISLIRNGIKIKYSQELRAKLSQLNAKLSLVNKENYRSRATGIVDNNSEEQVVAFSDEREIKPEDYKIEIRVPNVGDSDVLYEFDLEEVSDELRARSK